MNNTAHKWISGINKHPSHKKYIDWLNNEISFLDAKDRADIVSRIASQSDSSYHGAISELVYAAFWKHLKWNYTKEYILMEKTPDYKVTFDASNNQSFIGEVSVVTHNHPHQKSEFLESGQILVDGKPADELPTITNPIDQAHRFAMKLGQKYKKYKDIIDNKPFVICLYIHGFENNFYLSDFHINKALYGNLNFSFSDGETFYQPTVFKGQHNQNEYNGIFAFEDFAKLSAVIICREEWYPIETHNIEGTNQLDEFKSSYSFSISVNPFGCWPTITHNPFQNARLSVSGLIDDKNIKFNEPTSIEFY